MSRHPKSKLLERLTPIPPPKLAHKLKLLPQGDLRALAASSTAIALSIASPSDSADSDADREKMDSFWKTTYGAARMTVELTKESSDMFLPLKAVAGALSVLIKNYDVGTLPMAQRASPDPVPASRSSKHRIIRR